MDTKIRMMYGIDTAMHLLRPGARWEITNNFFSLCDDPRPCPTMEEVHETMEKIRAFEDSINTIYTDEQLEQITGQQRVYDKAVNG